MVRNKTELIAATNDWCGVAKRDIAQKTAAFLERTNLTPDRLASILDVDVNTVEGMLTGQVDLPMSVLAKILIATDHALVIMPASQAPAQGMPQRPAPRGGGMRPVGRPTMPARDANGRFTRRAPRPVMPQGEPYAPYGFPAPNPNGQLPPPEEVFENIPTPPQVDGFMPQEGFAPDGFADMPPMEAVPQGAANPDEEKFVAIARAINANPELKNLFNSLING